MRERIMINACVDDGVIDPFDCLLLLQHNTRKPLLDTALSSSISLTRNLSTDTRVCLLACSLLNRGR